MAQLFLEGRPVAHGQIGYFGHLYLVYRDDDGTETVFSGDAEGKFPFFGRIIVEDGVPMKQSQDERDDESLERRGQILLMSGDRAREALPKIKKSIRAIREAGIGYAALRQNSNTTIAVLLHSIGYFPDKLPEPIALDGTKMKLTYPGFCDAAQIQEVVESLDLPTEWEEKDRFCPQPSNLGTLWESLVEFLQAGDWGVNMIDPQRQDRKFLGSGHDDHSGLLPGDGGLEGPASGVAASDIPPAPVSWEQSGWDEEDSTRFYKNMEKLAEHTRKLRELRPPGLYNDRGEEIGPSILARLDWPWDTDANGSGARGTLYAGYATPSEGTRPPGARTRGIGSSWARGKARPVTPLSGGSLPGVDPSPDIGPLLDIGPPPYSQGMDPVRESSRLRGPYFRLRPQDMGRQPRPSGPSTETAPVTRYQASETVPDLPYFPDNPLLQEMIYISPKGMAWRRALQAEAASVATPPVDPDPTRYRGDRRHQFKPLLDLTPWLPQTD